MQDQNEDTEWNDILRAKGIIPEKPKENEITEDEIMAIMDKAIKDKSGGKPTILRFLLNELACLKIVILFSNPPCCLSIKKFRVHYM